MNRYFNAFLWRIKKFYQIILLKRKIRRSKIKELRLHVGCGSHKLEKYINIDYKLNKTVDLRLNLSEPKIFPENSVEVIFSNAFFEHLFRNERIVHLKYFYKALTQSGFICYIGIPYFKEVAKFYLRGDTYFNLTKVLGFTHGGGPIKTLNKKSKRTLFIADLHKGLYDENELKFCLLEAGFESFRIFKYCHPEEEAYPVNIGFYANKSSSPDDIDVSCLNYLKEYDKEKILIETLEFII